MHEGDGSDLGVLVLGLLVQRWRYVLPVDRGRRGGWGGARVGD